MRQILPLLFLLFFHVTNAQLSGIKTVGSGGDYATLTGIGGAFSAINTNGLSGNLELQIMSDISIEDGNNALNQWTESGAGNYTLNIYPTGSARVLSGNNTDGLIKFNGADRVTINGALAGVGSDRSLSINNTSTNPGSACIQIASLGTSMGATDNVIKNVNIVGGDNSVLTFGISVGNSVGTSGADNDNITIQNNSITRVGSGIYVSGTNINTAGGGDNIVIIGNTIGPAIAGSMNIGRYGIYVANILTSNISNNLVQNVTAIESSQVGIQLGANVTNSIVASNTITNVSCAFVQPIYGLSIGSDCSGITVEKNTISGIYNSDTVGHAARGIYVATGMPSSAITIKNNSISDIVSYAGVLQTNGVPLFSPVGIYLNGSSGGINVYANSVNLYGSHIGVATGSATTCLFVDASVSDVDMRNNILANTYDNSSSSGAMDNNYAIISAAASNAYTLIDFNNYAVEVSNSNANYYAGYLTSNLSSLAALKQAFGANINSILSPVQFTSNTNLLPVNAYEIIGTYLSSVPEDINGNVRSNPPAMGAYEVALSGIWSATAATAVWETGSNWKNGAVPGAGSPIYIPSSSSNMPVLSSSVTIKRLINNGILTIVGNVTVSVSQHIYNKGLINGPDAALVLNGSEAQIITLAGATGFINVNDFTLNNSSGAVISLDTSDGKLNVYNSMDILAGTLNTGDRVVLKSTSTKTARLPAVTGGITGKVTVETYIPSGRRAFRLIGHPFNETLGLNSIADDIDITGSGGSSSGFTSTASNSPSAFWFNNATGNSSSGINPGWMAFDSTSTTGNNLWSKGQGIRVLVRGAKGEGLDGSSYTPSAATLSMTGTLNTGTQTLTLYHGNSGYNLVGNPYACPVDIGSRIAAANNINGTVFWVWDPYAASTGSYVPVAIGGAYNLQANAVAIVDVAAGSSISFSETDKVASSSQNLLRNTGKSRLIELQVLNNGKYWDKLFVNYNKLAKPEKDAKDGMKMMNSVFNFYTLSANNDKLSMDARPMESSTVIPIGLSTNVLGTYTLHIADFGIESNTQVLLHDKLLNNYIKLEDSIDYSFQVTSDTSTQGENRFELVHQNGTSTVSAISAFGFKLSPNPARDIVRVNFTNIEEMPTTISIIDAEGKIVKSVNVGRVQSGQISMPLKGLAKGTYYVTLQSGNEKRVEKLQIQ